MKKIYITLLLGAVTFSGNLIAQIAPEIEWAKCLGGSADDFATSMVQTSDKGYIIAGYSESGDGDVSENKGGYDYWIVKLDMYGNGVWEESFGGSDDDYATCILETIDSGFIVSGYSSSNDGDVSGNHGNADYWIIKLNSAGTLLWQKTYGGSSQDYAYAIHETLDSGFIVVGGSASDNGDVTDNHDGYDFWLLRLDVNGNLIWEKSLGGQNDEIAFSVETSSDAGFVAAGYSNSSDGDVSGNNGDLDYWIAKTDSLGNLLWEQHYGGSKNDCAYSVHQKSDGGYSVAGSANSPDGDVSGHHSKDDYWILNLNASGNLIWQRDFGGPNYDEAYDIQQTPDEGFIVVGQADSHNGDISFNYGSTDCWLVKSDKNHGLVWEKSLGGSSHDSGRCLQPSSDGGYVICGYSYSNDHDVSGNHGSKDYWIVKLTSEFTGVSSPSTNRIEISPNPTQSLLTIQLSSPASQTIAVYDVQGKTINLPITLQNQTAQLNTSQLAEGFYTLQITNTQTGEVETGKFVKE